MHSRVSCSSPSSSGSSELETDSGISLPSTDPQSLKTYRQCVSHAYPVDRQAYVDYLNEFNWWSSENTRSWRAQGPEAPSPLTRATSSLTLPPICCAIKMTFILGHFMSLYFQCCILWLSLRAFYRQLKEKNTSSENLWVFFFLQALS